MVLTEAAFQDVWTSLLNAAVLGQLGRTDDAQPYLQRLLRLQPALREQGEDLIRRLLYPEKIADMVYEGLQRAGFSIDANPKLRSIRSDLLLNILMLVGDFSEGVHMPMRMNAFFFYKFDFAVF